MSAADAQNLAGGETRGSSLPVQQPLDSRSVVQAFRETPNSAVGRAESIHSRRKREARAKTATPAAVAASRFWII